MNTIGISYGEAHRGKPRGASLQTIERVATIFDVVAQGAQGISLKELSAKVGLPKVLRIVFCPRWLISGMCVRYLKVKITNSDLNWSSWEIVSWISLI